MRLPFPSCHPDGSLDWQLIREGTGDMRGQTAVVGVGATPYFKRGQSVPETQLSMACTAILAALADAGLTVADLNGFTIYSNAVDPAQVASVLGVPEVRSPPAAAGRPVLSAWLQRPSTPGWPRCVFRS
jgi:hypothetical protein